MTTRQPKHRGGYDEHDARLWTSEGRVLAACDRCNTTGKGKYRKREAS